MSNKYFSNKSIGLATYLGGPISGGFLIALNLRRIDAISKAVWTLIFSLLTTALLFAALLKIPEEIIDKIPSAVIPAVYTPFVILLANKIHGIKIREALEEKENHEHWWKGLVVGLIGTVVTLAIIFGFAMYEPLFPGERITYGEVENEIYLSEHAERQYADVMYDRLYSMGYFHDDFSGAAYLEKGDGSYKIILYVDESFWENPEIISSLTAFKWGMETETGKSIEVYMRHADLSGEKDKLLE